MAYSVMGDLQRLYKKVKKYNDLQGVEKAMIWYLVKTLIANIAHTYVNTYIQSIVIINVLHHRILTSFYLP